MPAHAEVYLNIPGSSAARTGRSFHAPENDAPFPFTMAFQPIVHASGVFAYEALVRGPSGESAGSILARVNESNRYAFDQACRVKAIELTARLSANHPQHVSINFMPGAVYSPEACIRRTLETAERVGIALTSIIFEITEGERVADPAYLSGVFREYRRHGLRTAIDDFGAAYAGLDLLAEFQPDILKLDMALIRNIDQRPASRAVVRAIVSICRELGIQLIAEGVETLQEFGALQNLGIELFQGYLFARPQLERFVPAAFPGRPIAAPLTASAGMPLPGTHLLHTL